MSDETNGNNSRLDRIEAVINELAEQNKRSERVLTEKIQELVHAQMRNEAKPDNYAEQAKKYRQESDERFARMEKHLEHLTQLAGFFGGKSFEFDDKIKKVGEILLTGDNKSAA